MNEQQRRAAFYAQMFPIAQQWAARSGIPAEVLLAWMASESNFGNAPSLFGVKGTGDVGSANLATHEVYGGQAVNINDQFAAYSSPDAAFNAMLDLVSTAPRYRDAYARLQAGDWAGFMQGINASGYATDPGWASMVMQMAQEVPATMDRGGVAPPQGTPPTALSATTTEAVRNIVQNASTDRSLTPEELAEIQGLLPQGPAIPAGAEPVEGMEGYYWDPITGLPVKAEDLAGFTTEQIAQMVKRGDLTPEQGAQLHQMLNKDKVDPARLEYEMQIIREIEPDLSDEQLFRREQAEKDFREGRITEEQYNQIIADLSAEPTEQQTAAQQIEARFRRGEITEQQRNAELAGLEHQQSQQATAGADAALQALEQQLGTRVFRIGPGQGFYYDAKGNQVPVTVDQYGNVTTGEITPGNRQVAQGPGGVIPTNPARAAAIEASIFGGQAVPGGASAAPPVFTGPPTVEQTRAGLAAGTIQPAIPGGSVPPGIAARAATPQLEPLPPPPGGAPVSAMVAPGWLNAPVTQGFGPTDTTLDSAYAGAAHFNKGIDYGVPTGTPIEALVGGTVESAGDAGDGWGISVKVRDAQGNLHNYGHLSGVNVQPGQQITPGMLVGASGSTGKSTGPHLSYDVSNAAGEFIDPSGIIEAARTGQAGGAPAPASAPPPAAPVSMAAPTPPPPTPAAPVNQQGTGYVVTPEDAAIVANLGQVQGAEYLRQKYNLGYTPTLPEINAMIGTSIGYQPVTNLAGGRVSPQELAVLAGGPMLPGAGNTRGSEATLRFEEAALRAYPEQPGTADDIRRQQYIASNLGSRNIAIATDKAPAGVNRQLNQFGQPLASVSPGSTTFTRTIGGETETVTQPDQTILGLENLDVMQAGTGTSEVRNINGEWYVVDPGPPVKILYGPLNSQAIAQNLAGVAGYHEFWERAEDRGARLSGGTPQNVSQIDQLVAGRAQAAQQPRPQSLAPLAPQQPQRPMQPGRPPGGWGPPDQPPVLPEPYVPPGREPYPGLIYQAQGGVNVAGAGGAGMNGMGGFNTPGEIGMFQIDAQGNPIRLLSVAGEGPDGLGGMTAPERISVQPQDVTMGRELAALAPAYTVPYRLSYV